MRKLSLKETALLCEAAFALAVASFAVARLPFDLLARSARRPRRQVGPEFAKERIRTVAWAVAAIARRVPWRAKCLEQAFAAQWMLRRRSVSAAVHYGAALADGDLVAHAWVRAGETDVIGCRGRDDFVEVARFPA